MKRNITKIAKHCQLSPQT